MHKGDKSWVWVQESTSPKKKLGVRLPTMISPKFYKSEGFMHRIQPLCTKPVQKEQRKKKKEAKESYNNKPWSQIFGVDYESSTY